MMRSTVSENIKLKLDKKVPSNSFCSVSRYSRCGTAVDK
jgi:hypothetical protein